MHMIATAPRTDPEMTTLMARREVWDAFLAEIPERTDRAAWGPIRQRITTALAGDGDIIRVTVPVADADRLLLQAGLAP